MAAWPWWRRWYAAVAAAAMPLLAWDRSITLPARPLPMSAPRRGQAQSGTSITRVRRLRGGYRNPYRDEYFRHFRPGYRPFVLGDAQYYGYDTLPPGYQQVVLKGIVYYLFDGVYYQPYIYGGQTVYLVVPTQ